MDNQNQYPENQPISTPQPVDSPNPTVNQAQAVNSGFTIPVNPQQPSTVIPSQPAQLTGNPTSNNNFAYQNTVPSGTKKVNIKIPGWMKVIFGFGLSFTIIIVALVLFGVYTEIQHSRHLAKVGVTGQAVVVSEQNVESTQGVNSGNNYMPPTYQTNIKYKLINVPGFTNQVFSSSLPSQYNKPAVYEGQDVTVLYDPHNPSNNDIKSNVTQSGYATIIFAAVFVFFGIAVIFLIVSIHQFNRRRKITSDLKNGV